MQELINSIETSKTLFSLPVRETDLSDWKGHIPFAMWLVETMRPALLVELGTYKGDSYSAFCQAMAGTASKGRCFAVDTWAGDDHVGHYSEEIFSEFKPWHDKTFKGFSELLRMTFDQAISKFDNNTIDILHIDGLHTYEAVKHDFENWLPKMSARGVILLHDTTVKERGFGIWRFFAEISEQYPSFNLPESHGLGVVLVGNKPPCELQAICNASETRRSRIIEFFTHLGQRCLYQRHKEYWFNSTKDSLNRGGESVLLSQTILELGKETYNQKMTNSLLLAKAVFDQIYFANMFDSMKNELSRQDTTINKLKDELFKQKNIF